MKQNFKLFRIKGGRLRQWLISVACEIERAEVRFERRLSIDHIHSIIFRRQLI